MASNFFFTALIVFCFSAAVVALAEAGRRRRADETGQKIEPNTEQRVYAKIATAALWALLGGAIWWIWE